MAALGVPPMLWLGARLSVLLKVRCADLCQIGILLIEDLADMIGETRASLVVKVEGAVDSHCYQFLCFVIKLCNCGNDTFITVPSHGRGGL